MNRLVVLGLVFACVASGCGVFGGSSSCDFRDGGANGPEPRCQERVNTVSPEAFKGACVVAQGSSASGACPRAGAVGGCEIGTQGDGSKVNDWYYPPTTREEAQMQCTKDNGKFLEP